MKAITTAAILFLLCACNSQPVQVLANKDSVMNNTRVTQKETVRIIDSVAKAQPKDTSAPHKYKHYDVDLPQNIYPELKAPTAFVKATLKKVRRNVQGLYCDLYDSTNNSFSFKIETVSDSVHVERLGGWWLYYPAKNFIVDQMSYDTLK